MASVRMTLTMYCPAARSSRASASECRSVTARSAAARRSRILQPDSPRREMYKTDVIEVRAVVRFEGTAGFDGCSGAQTLLPAERRRGRRENNGGVEEQT